MDSGIARSLGPPPVEGIAKSVLESEAGRPAHLLAQAAGVGHEPRRVALARRQRADAQQGLAACPRAEALPPLAGLPPPPPGGGHGSGPVPRPGRRKRAPPI